MRIKRKAEKASAIRLHLPHFPPLLLLQINQRKGKSAERMDFHIRNEYIWEETREKSNSDWDSDSTIRPVATAYN